MTFLDLRSPLSDQLMRILQALESMEAGETLSLVHNQDIKPLLGRLHPVLAGSFEWSILEDGPEVWKVAFQKKGPPQAAPAND